MFERVRAALNWESIKAVPARMAGFWPWIKLRWQKNPGFVAAAAAGSVGLVLTILLVLQGGIQFLDSAPSRDETPDLSLSADLGEPGKVVPDPELAGIFEEPSTPVRSSSRRGDPDAEPGSELEEDSALFPPQKKFAANPAPKSKAGKKTHPLEMNADEDEIDDTPVSNKRPAPKLPDDDPFAGDDDAPPKVARQPAKVDDDPELEMEEADDSLELAAKPSDKNPAKLKSNIGAAIQEEATDETEPDDSADKATEIAVPAEKPKPPTPAGWKNQPSKAPSASEPPSAIARQSRAVETVIYAAPNATGSTSEPSSKAQAGATAPQQLLIEIAGPQSAGVGQPCNFEIRVKNTGRISAQNLILTVELPAQLTHELGPSIEQQVEEMRPGQTYRALVRTRTKSAGKVALSASIAAAGRVAAKLSATVEIRGSVTTTGKVASPQRQSQLVQ